jgi:hypothetical protein
MLLEPNPNSRFKFNEPNWPLMIRVKDKYSEYFYIVNKPQDAYDVSLRILTERLNEGYWYHEPTVPDTFEEYFLNLFGITVEEAAVLSKLKLSFQAYGSASGLLARYRRIYKDDLNSKAEFQIIKKAVLEKNGKLAYRILLSRSDYEYERFEIIKPEET